MRRKCLLLIVFMVIFAASFTMLSTKSEAVTEQELEEYMYEEHDFPGIKFIIRDADKVKVEKFFRENDLTDAEATKIKNIIDDALKLMNEDGATEPNKLSTKEKKQQLINYAKEAVGILGYTASYDATETRLDIYKNGALVDSVSLNWGVTLTEDGKKVVTSESKLIKTGSLNLEYIIIPCVVFVAGTMLIIARKKANE